MERSEEIMTVRKDLLIVGEVYHVFNKSIAGFKIFNKGSEFSRIIDTIHYYQKEKPPVKFSRFIKLAEADKNCSGANISCLAEEKLVEVIAYCIMPTHLHLILKQLKEGGISNFMGNILNSYTRYFNTKYKRKGPLWEGRFKNVLVKNDEQLLHLTRYVHLNPVTAYLIEEPQNWKYSSYKEFLGEKKQKECICDYSVLLDINPETYKEFVNSQIDYQRELSEIKKLFLD